MEEPPSPRESSPEQTGQPGVIRREYPSIEGAQCPYEFFARARKDAPIFHESGTNRYLISRHEDILNILKNTRTFSSWRSRAGLLDTGPEQRTFPTPGTAIIELDDPQHKPAR